MPDKEPMNHLVEIVAGGCAVILLGAGAFIIYLIATHH